MNGLLFTGASGFLGKNLNPILRNSYKVKTLGISDNNDIKVNLAETVPSIDNTFDIILHAAGKVYADQKKNVADNTFFEVNFQGTVNLCRALEKRIPPKAFIFISTVAVYGLDSGINITEDFPLKGSLPYALSKIRAEEFLTDWCKRHDVTLSILRPPLIAGSNPHGNLGAMVKAIKSGRYLSIDGGKARKSVLMAQDIARLLPALIKKGGVYNVCDDEQFSLRDLEISISKQLGRRPPISIPYRMAKTMALTGDLLGNKAFFNSTQLKKMTESLTFSNKKAKRELNWQPINVLENFKIR